MDGLRDGLDPLGHSVPLHQDRRRRRRAARVPGLRPRRARRRRAHRAGLARRHAGRAARARALAGALRGLRDRRALPAHRGRRAARRLVAGGDPHRHRAAVRRAAGAALRPRRARDGLAPRRAPRGAGRASSRWSASTSPGAATSCSAAGAILLAAVGYAAGPMVLKRQLADLDPRAAMGASLVIAAVAPRAARRGRPARGGAVGDRRSSRWSCSGCSAPRRRSSSSAC